MKNSMKMRGKTAIYTRICISVTSKNTCTLYFQIRYLSLVGGGDAAETARRVMKKLGTNQLWSSFNVHGRKGKRGLKNTRFFPVIVSKF